MRRSLSKEQKIKLDFQKRWKRKLCKTCKKLVPIDKFRKRKGAVDGLKSNCNDCHRVMQRRYINTEVGFMNQLWGSVKRRAKRDNLEIGYKNKTEFFMHWEEQKNRYGMKCPATGMTMTHYNPVQDTIKNKEEYGEKYIRSKNCITNISPDRILKWKGYTKENVIFTSWYWNNIKNQITPGIAKTFLSIVKARYGTEEIYEGEDI